MASSEEDVAVQHVDGAAAGRRRHPAHRTQRQRVCREVRQKLQAMHAAAAAAATAAAAAAAVDLLVLVLLLLLLWLQAAVLLRPGLPGGELEQGQAAVPTPHR